MEYLVDPLLVLALLGAGVVAGFVNTLAGGGGLLILPLLMLTGMSAAQANGTMRVGVFIQGAEAVRQFHRRGSMPFSALPAILIPSLLGAVLGALAASYLPESFLKPVMLITLVCVALVMVLRPERMAPPAGTVPLTPRESRAGWWWLAAAGFYGGFIQAGVGFVLLAALVGQLQFDLIRANALKMAVTTVFTVPALMIFAWRDQVEWLPGLLVAVGAVIGARFGVGYAHRVSPRVLRKLLLVMVVTVCIAAALKG